MVSPGHSPLCSVCTTPAVFFDRENARHLCASHFSGYIEEQVLATIMAENLVPPGSRIAVALSGGKDSSVLLYLLHRLQGRLGITELVAVTVDEGIAGYRDETMEAAGDLCQRLGIPSICVSFEDRFGETLDRMLAGREHRACSYCGTFRKRLIEEGARRARATLVATGHCLDDEVQAAAMNVLKADMKRITRELPDKGRGPFIPRIKPLFRLMEREVALYAMLSGLYRDLPECPYTPHALRAEVRELLNRFEMDSPGAMRLMMRRYESFRKCMRKKYPPPLPLGRCSQCGAPASGMFCRVCTLLKEGTAGSDVQES
jgi:uncharacterized protein (TIGR00269 family)